MSSFVISKEYPVRGVAPARRRLGSRFAPPRDLYMLYIPIFMIAVGLTCWVVTTDFMLMIGSVSLALVSIFLFYDLLVRQAPLRVSTLLATTLGLGYGGGAANSWFTVPRSGTPLGEFLHRDPIQLTHSMGSILFALAILLAVGEVFEKPVFGEDFKLEFTPQSIVFITFGVLLLLVAYAHGTLGYMGGQVGASGDAGPFVSFAVWVIGSLFAITFVAAMNAKTRGMKRYLIVLTLIQFILEIPVGRRSMVFAVVLALIAIRLGRFRFNWGWSKRIMVGAVIVVTLYITSIGFFYLRLAGFSSKTPLTFVERVTLAIHYFETKDYAEVKEQFSKNVQVRTFILGWVAELEGYSGEFTPGLGQDLIGQFQTAIPSVIYPGKNRNFGEEGLANELFGTAYWDEANSIFTAGVVDFGFLGLILYPLAVAFMVRAFFEFMVRYLPTFASTFVIVASLAVLLQPETPLLSYFTVIRNGALFGCVIWFFLAMPALRLQRVHV